MHTDTVMSNFLTTNG